MSKMSETYTLTNKIKQLKEVDSLHYSMSSLAQLESSQNTMADPSKQLRHPA